MSRKKLLAAGLGLILFLTLVLFVFKGGGDYAISPVVVKNLDNAYVSGSGEVYFYTGHGFAKYSPGGQSTTTLSEFMNFPGILDVSINDKGAVFKTSEAFETDSLYYYLKKRGLPPDRFYWWFTDFRTGKTSLVAENESFPNEIVSVKQSGDDLLVARQVDSYALDKTFEIYRQVDGKLEFLYKKSDEKFVQFLWANKEKAVFSSQKRGQANVTLSTIDLANKAITELPATVGGGSVAVSHDGNFLAFQISSLGDDPSEESLEPGLYTYRIGEEGPDLVLKNFVGDIKTASSSDFFLVSGYTEKDKQVFATLGFDGKYKGFGIKGEVPRVLFVIGGLNDASQLMATDDSKNLYILHKDKEDFSQPPAVPEEARDISGVGYDINYFESSNSFSILVTKKPYSKNLQFALEHLQKLGVDTNQHPIIANATRGLDVTL